MRGSKPQFQEVQNPLSENKTLHIWILPKKTGNNPQEQRHVESLVPRGMRRTHNGLLEAETCMALGWNTPLECPKRSKTVILPYLPKIFFSN
jgi:hypothetical protein